MGKRAHAGGSVPGSAGQEQKRYSWRKTLTRMECIKPVGVGDNSLASCEDGPDTVRGLSGGLMIYDDLDDSIRVVV